MNERGVEIQAGETLQAGLFLWHQTESKGGEDTKAQKGIQPVG